LLAYLALATAGPVRRDALLSLFWPELGDEEARRALRQALHHLRRAIGSDVFVSSGDELSLRADVLRCDASTFERLAGEGRFQDALALYRGDFFDGFHVDDVAPELEEWIERTRTRLKRRAATVAWSASDAAAAAGDGERAVEFGRRACDLEPDQEAGWRRLMTLQDRLGDRAGALRAYESLEARLAREFDAKPAAETRALAERIRRTERSPSLPDSAAPQPIKIDQPRDAIPEIRRAPAPQRRWLRPALLGGVVGALAVVAVAGAYIKLWAGDHATSLVSTGSLAPKDRVVVAEFANLSGDSLLSAGITEAFRIDLSQSPIVRVLSGGQIASALQRMERAPDTPLHDALARELAEREGAKAVVTGTVANVAGVFTVSAQLTSAPKGDVLVAIRETAPDSSHLMVAVDRASKELRRHIGESLRSLRASPPLAQETTGSLAALRVYTQGRRLVLQSRRPEAIRKFEEAIALDTGFASAYIALGQVYGSVAEAGRAQDAQRHAVAHQDRLPFIERTFTVASYAYGVGDFETALASYNRALERFPDDYRILNNLALIYRDRRQFAIAESLFARAAAVDSTVANFYFGMHSAQVLQGNFRESRRTLDLIARRFPGNPILLNVEIQDASAQHNWEDAERRAETAISAAAGDTLQLVDPYEALAAITMTQGRLAEAKRLWRTHLRISALSGSRGRHLYGLIQVANLHLRYEADTARALAVVDSALAATPLDSVLPGDRLYDELARFYASAGRLTRARELLEAAAVNDSVIARTPGPERTWTRGVIALAEGRAADAESELNQAAAAAVCTICVLPDLARAYDATRKLDAATLVYERYVTTPWLYRYETDAAELGWALRRLAELHDLRGETAKAAAVRARLVQLWKQADPELQPFVSEARRRIAG
jgi:DNA-binding SARP family transcriptional activator/TolB-like protein/Tfp pilus assembly protein PilF